MPLNLTDDIGIFNKKGLGLEDDIGLSKKSSLVDDLGILAKQTYQSIGLGAGDILTGTASSIENAPKAPPPYMTIGMFEDWKKSSPEQVEAVKRGDRIGKNIASEKLYGLAKNYPELKEATPFGLAGQAVTGIARSAAPMVATIIDPAAGVATTIASIKGNKYNQYIKEGKDEKTANDAADISALLTAPVEFAGNLIPIKSLTKLIEKSKVGATVGEYITEVLKSAASEGFEELTQTQLDVIADQYANNPDADPIELGKNVAKQIATKEHVIQSAQSLAVGAMGGAGLTGVIGAPSMIKGKGEQPTVTQKPDNTQAILDSIKEDFDAGNLTPEIIASLKQQLPELSNDIDKITSQPDNIIELRDRILEKEQEIGRRLTEDEIIELTDLTTATPAIESAQVFKNQINEEDRLRQSLQGKEGLRNQLENEARIVEEAALNRPLSPAEESARAIESELNRIDQLNQSPIGKEGLKQRLLSQTEIPSETMMPESTIQSETMLPEQKIEPEITYNGLKYKYLGETILKDEQVGKWQVLNSKGNWVDVKGLNKLRRLDNERDNYAENTGRTAEETSGQISQTWQTPQTGGGIDQGSQGQIRIRESSDATISKTEPIKVQRSSDEAGENTLYEVIEGPQKGSSISRGAITQTPEKYAVDENLMPTIAAKKNVNVNDAMAKELERLQAKKAQQTKIEESPYEIIEKDSNPSYAKLIEKESSKLFRGKYTDALIIKSPKNPNQWQVSFFDKKGIPNGDSQVKSYDEAIKEAINISGISTTEDISAVKELETQVSINKKIKLGRNPNYARDFRDWIRRTGGLNPNDKDYGTYLKEQAYTIDSQGKKKLAQGWGYLWNKKSRGVDDRTLQAIEHGWLPPGSTEQDFIDLLLSNPSSKDKWANVGQGNIDIDIKAEEAYYKERLEDIANGEYTEDEADADEREVQNDIKAEASESDISEAELERIFGPTESEINQSSLLTKEPEKFQLTPDELTDEEKIMIGKRKGEITNVPKTGKRIVIPNEPIKIGTTGKQETFLEQQKGETGDLFAPKKQIEKKANKEPWTMTWQEYINSPQADEIRAKYKMPGNSLNANAKIHEESVQQALSEGKPVSMNVIADYPDLQSKPAEQKPSGDAVQEVAPIPKSKPGSVYLDKGGRKPFFEAKEIKRGVKKGKYTVILTSGKKVIVNKEAIKEWPQEAQKVTDAKARIISKFTEEKGSISLEKLKTTPIYKDLLTVGNHYYSQGMTRFQDFRSSMQETFSDVWDKIKQFISKIFRESVRFYKESKLGEERGSISFEDKKPTAEEYAKNLIARAGKKTEETADKTIETLTKPSKLAKRTEAEAIEDGMIKEGWDNLVEYETSPEWMKSQSEKAAKFINDDYATAEKVALGEEPAPKGIELGFIYRGVKNKARADKNNDLLYKLGTEAATPTIASILGQQIKAFDDSSNIEDPTIAMRLVEKERKAKLKRQGKKGTSTAEVKKIKEKLDDAEKKLTEKTDSLKNKSEVDVLKKQLDESIEKPELTDLQRINRARQAIFKSIEIYSKKINEKDLTPINKRTPIQTEELTRLREKRDILKKQLNDLRDLSRVKRTKEDIALQRTKTRLKNETDKLIEKLKSLDLEKTTKKEVVYDVEAKKLKHRRDTLKAAYDSALASNGTVTREEADRLIELSQIMDDARNEMEKGGDRHKYGAAKVVFLRYIDHLKGSDRTLKAMLKDEWAEVKAAWKENKPSAFTKSVKDILQFISDLSISLMASMDNSFIGRQGLNTLLTHPTVWGPAAKKSFVDIYKTLVSKHGGQIVRDAAMADAYSRPNYESGDYDIAKLIPKSEEQFPISIPERIPVLGRAFKASENAFLNSGVRMRIDTYDLLKRIAEEQGIKIDKEWIQETGKLINSVTARGDLGKYGHGGALRLIFWAPKMLKGNIDVLTAHFGGAGLKTEFARQQARINLAKIVGLTILAAAVADGLGEAFGKKDTVEWNPLSSDFMKVKVGDTRYDLTGGKGSLVTLAARALTFKTKSTKTRKVTDLNSGKFGSKTMFDVMVDFMANKSAPLTKTGIDIARGRNFDYEKPGIANTTYNLATPIGVQNFIETFYEGNKKAEAQEVVGNILDMVGINASTYDSKQELKKKYKNLRDKGD